jgi:hypothetical protein
VLASQQRRLIAAAMEPGAHHACDYQPPNDASRRVIRSHVDLDTLKASALSRGERRSAGMMRAVMLALARATAPAHVADPAVCRVVRMGSPGWADIAATNALGGVVLDALG